MKTMALYDLETARKLVIQAGLKLQQLGLIARTWGNISVRIHSLLLRQAEGPMKH